MVHKRLYESLKIIKCGLKNLRVTGILRRAEFNVRQASGCKPVRLRNNVFLSAPSSHYIFFFLHIVFLQIISKDCFCPHDSYFIDFVALTTDKIQRFSDFFCSLHKFLLCFTFPIGYGLRSTETDSRLETYKNLPFCQL